MPRRKLASQLCVGQRSELIGSTIVKSPAEKLEDSDRMPARAIHLAQVTTLRRRVLDAARQNVEAAGPNSLRLRAIAGSIGCGVASLYHHFADKDQLLAALATEGFQDLRRQMQHEMKGDRCPTAIRRALTGYSEFMGQHTRLYALMHTDHILANHPAVRRAEEDAANVLYEALIIDGHIPAHRAKNVALMLWALLRGLAAIILTRGDHDPETALRFTNEIIDGYEANGGLIAVRD